MTAFDNDDPAWRTSSYSGTGGGQCVEVATGRSAAAVRDSKQPDDVTLTFSATAWTVFVEAAAAARL